MEKEKKTPEWLLILFLIGIISLLVGVFSHHFAEWLIGSGLFLVGVYGIYREYIRGEDFSMRRRAVPVLILILGLYILGTMIYWTFIR